MGAGGFEKLTLTAYKDDGFATLADVSPGSITVAINPASYSLTTGICFTDEAAAGSTGEAKSFNRGLGSTLSFDLVFDGTGAVGDAGGKSVDAQIEDFRTVTLEINGSIHRPNYVRLAWGTFGFNGQLQSLALDYTLFNPDGSALRAKAKAAFVGVEQNRKARLKQGLTSPDLTHVVTVGPGDTLPLMCDRIYGDSGYYLKVAEANGLTGFRSLPIGTVLVFPPLAGPQP
ncbi:CIS tube protein [Allosphingosinicella sp.]|jgi:hypothetical protein|uniref:CIS tube protein n=1 Tax=Allosphingosinicella sp. TaxID=2823234 RepID=UPI002F214273